MDFEYDTNFNAAHFNNPDIRMKTNCTGPNMHETNINKGDINEINIEEPSNIFSVSKKKNIYQAVVSLCGA